MPEIQILYTRGRRTGGPEALHQLCDSLRRQGAPAVLVPTPETSAESRVPEYARYDAPEREHLVDEEGALVVAPETHFSLLQRVRTAQRLCWWLSIDNSQLFVNERRLAELRDGRAADWPRLVKHALLRSLWVARRSVLPVRSMRHAAQSEYARAFLYTRLGVSATMLTDYTDLPVESPSTGEREPVVAYNHSKGGYWSERIAERVPEARFVPIKGMSREQVVQTLRTSAVYLDMGHQPGRDRMPREAAAVGAVVLVANRGAGFFDLDVPLDARFKIDTAAPVGDGATKVRRALLDLTASQRSQDRYRHRIARERATFDEEVRTAFAAWIPA